MNILKSKYYLVRFPRDVENHIVVMSDGNASFRDALNITKRSTRLQNCRILKGSVIINSADPSKPHNSRNPVFTIEIEHA